MILGLIPARGGSKRLPGKNLREIGGKSLLQWAIESAQQSKRLTQFIVSTDSEVVAEEAFRYNPTVLNLPPVLAADQVPMIDVLRHVAGAYPGAHLLITVQPTTPFRTGALIDTVIDAFLSTQADSAVTVHHGRPTGEVYVTTRALLDSGRMLGPNCLDVDSFPEYGPEIINIDTEYDLVKAERYYDAYIRHR